MRILSVIQPSELGSDFLFQDGVWKVNFPVGGNTDGNQLSIDENNALTTGSDGGLYLSKDLLNAYAMVQDNQSQKIHLYRFPAGTEFNVETATLASSVSLIEMTGIFDDVAIDGEVITFTDADNGLTLTLDTANLQRVSSIIGSDTIDVQSVNGETTLAVKIDPRSDNAISVSEDGLYVQGVQGDGDLNLHQTLAVVEDGLCHAVGDSHLVMPQIELVDIAGNSIGYINDIIGLPVSSQTHGPDHCPEWEAPTANNCRVGKVAVALIPDLMYDFDPEDESIEWRVFFNGEDTGYIAAPPKLAPPPEVDQPMLMSLTQNDFGDADDFIGKGWLEEIISNATNGAISGSYEEGVTLLNETNQQVILTLVPNKPISLDYIRNVYNEGEGVTIFGLTLDEITAIRNGDNLEAPPTVENLEDYFDEETGVLSICLAPNGSGNGGSTGPQISCADATDRFATSGLWNKWTLKINGQQVVTAGHYSEIFDALDNVGVYAQHNGELETVFRNNTDSNIRIELIAVQENQWDQNGVELDLTTNPTLMGYDPIQRQMAAFAFNSKIIDDEPKIYSRLTVCLAPANTWMNWDYKDLDTSTAVVTLTNSISLIDADQDFSFEGDTPINVYTGTDKWGDLTWTIQAEEPTRLDIRLLITAQNYEDEFTVDFLARKPMVITLANTHEYSRPIEVHSPFEGIKSTIASIEVVGKNGSTVISNPEDGLVIDAALGAVRIEDLENGKFTYMVQGRFVDSEISDTMMVKFVTDTDLEEVVIVDLATNSNPGFQPVSANAYSNVVIGLVDNNGYTDVRDLPAIYAVSPDWTYRTLERVNGVGGEMVLDFDFTRASTYKLYIHAYLNGARLAVLGDCVIGVDQWGETEAGAITFNRETYNSRFDEGMDFSNVSKNNLSYVPAESPSNLQDMTGMFAGTDLSSPDVDLSAYNVGMVYSMAGVFARSNFNGNILGWSTRYISNMDYAFYGSKYRQNLSLWCVSNIYQEPKLFSYRAPLLSRHKPVWGTCPLEAASYVEIRNSAGYGSEHNTVSIPANYSVNTPASYNSKYISLTCHQPLLVIGDRAFKDQEITELSFLHGLKQIGAEAFMNNPLETVTIYSGITNIGNRAFYGTPMRFLAIEELTPPKLGNEALPATMEGIYVPDEAVARFKAADGWSDFASIIGPLSTAPGVFYNPGHGGVYDFPHYFIGDVIPEDAVTGYENIILSINEGVVELGPDSVHGKADYLRIPSSLTNVGTASLNLRAEVLEFPEGFTDNQFMIDSRPTASLLILPSTTTAIKGIFVGSRPNVICCKALTPPALDVSEYTHAFSNGKLLRTIVVPAESIPLYQADPHWNALTNNFTPLENFSYGIVTRVGKGEDGNGGLIVRGETSPEHAGKEVLIVYSDYRYNPQLGDNVRSDITIYGAPIDSNGEFRLTVPLNTAFATQYVTAYIGQGPEKVAS